MSLQIMDYMGENIGGQQGGDLANTHDLQHGAPGHRIPVRGEAQSGHPRPAKKFARVPDKPDSEPQDGGQNDGQGAYAGGHGQAITGAGQNGWTRLIGPER